jgi:hypothetical protein
MRFILDAKGAQHFIGPSDRVSSARLHHVIHVRTLLVVAVSLGAGCQEPDPEPDTGYLADREAPCELASQWYRIDGITVPTGSETRDTALDIDLDPQGRGDAQANNVLALLYSDVDAEVARDPILANIEAALADGRATWLIEEQRCADGAVDHQRVGMYRGVPAGDGFAVVADAPPAVGTTEITPNRGAAWVPVSVFLDVAPDLPIEWSRAQALTVMLTADDDGGVDGRLGVGIVGPAAALGPALGRFFTAQLDNAWPSAIGMDRDQDGVVTADEATGDEFVRSTIFEDLNVLAELDGELTLWFNHDWDNDALSFALAFHAVPIAPPQR